jgi:hypothetical protein
VTGDPSTSTRPSATSPWWPASSASP